MKKNTDNKSPRCLYRTECGRRCRKPVLAPESRFCALHEEAGDSQAEPDLSTTLTEGLDKFSSPAAINDFLSRLLLLLSQNRISPRRAAVLAYITNQILRTISVMEQQAAAAQNPKKRPVQIVWDIPGPEHERQGPQH